jgi:hypothetical protein
VDSLSISFCRGTSAKARKALIRAVLAAPLMLPPRFTWWTSRENLSAICRRVGLSVPTFYGRESLFLPGSRPGPVTFHRHAGRGPRALAALAAGRVVTGPCPSCGATEVGTAGILHRTGCKALLGAWSAPAAMAEPFGHVRADPEAHERIERLLGEIAVLERRVTELEAQVRGLIFRGADEAP